MDIEVAFREAMLASGLDTDDPISADGKFRRIHIKGDKPGQKNAWYLIFTDGVPAGRFGCHKRKVDENWCWKNRTELSKSERAALARNVQRAKEEREREKRRRQRETSEQAKKIWDESPPADESSPYLLRKSVKPHGLRMDGETLLASLRDYEDMLWSLQRINPDGTKKYLLGSRTQGCYYAIGTPKERIYIVEGFATGATVREVTGDAVAVAFSANNLTHVAKALSKKFPTLQIVVAADDDFKTDGNPGKTSAIEAAQEVGGLVALPVFQDRQAGTDFNDLFIAEGQKAVQKQLEAAAPPEPSNDPQAKIEAWLEGGSSDLDVIEKHLQGLDAIQYDRLRNKVAGHAEIRVSTLDNLVKSDSPKSGAIEGQGTSIDWEDTIPWPEPVDGASLLDELVSTFQRYIILPPGAAETIALWTVHTHAHEAAFISPYLALRSPEKRCGKTLTLQLLSALVPKPLPASNITPSALFRAVDKWHPTLLVDEADTFIRRNDELAGILNSGHTKASAWVVRTVQVGDDFEPRRFSTWAPKAIALIGNLKDTLQDRSIVISMRRKTREEKVERLRLDRVDEFETLRRKVARWVADYFDKMTNADPKVPRSLNDREQDNWRPLLAIADLAGCKWPARARQAAETLSGYSDADDGSIKVQLLQDIHDAFEEAGYPKAMKTVDLLSVLHEAEDRPWYEWKKGKPMSPHSLATQLRPYGIKPTQIRFGEESLKGYYLETFLDAFSRYLPPQSETIETININNDLQHALSETPERYVSDKAPHKFSNNNVVSDVPDRSPTPSGGIWKDVNFFPMVETPKNRCCDCIHFIPDPVNPPQGIGKCKVDAPYGPNDPARYPKAKRRCKQFQVAEEVA